MQYISCKFANAIRYKATDIQHSYSYGDYPVLSLKFSSSYSLESNHIFLKTKFFY